MTDGMAEQYTEEVNVRESRYQLGYNNVSGRSLTTKVVF